MNKNIVQEVKECIEIVAKGNELLAKFMEWAYLDKFNYPEENKIGWYDSDGKYMGIELEFLSSWNALMLVAEEIRTTESCENFNISIFGGCKIELYDGKTTIINTDVNAGITTKLATWMSCVEFVEWYNTKNKLA